MDEQEMYNTLVARAAEEGVVTSSAWNDLVDAVVEEQYRDGSLADDNDTEQLKADLRERFQNYETDIQA